MKKAILSILFIGCITALSTAQEESFNDFKREFNHRDGVHSFTVPGFLVRLVGGIALNDEDAVDREAIKPLLRNMGSVSVMFTDDHYGFDRDAFIKLKADLLDENYETLVKIKDERSHVEILGWSKKNVVKRLVLLIHDDDDESAILNIRGHFTSDDIEDMINAVEKKERRRM